MVRSERNEKKVGKTETLQSGHVDIGPATGDSGKESKRGGRAPEGKRERKKTNIPPMSRALYLKGKERVYQKYKGEKKKVLRARRSMVSQSLSHVLRSRTRATAQGKRELWKGGFLWGVKSGSYPAANRRLGGIRGSRKDLKGGRRDRRRETKNREGALSSRQKRKGGGVKRSKKGVSSILTAV